MQELYGGRLSAHASVAQHTMAGVAGAGPAAADLPVLLLIDTAGCDMEEHAEEEGDSKVRRWHKVQLACEKEVAVRTAEGLGQLGSPCATLHFLNWLIGPARMPL